MNIRNLLFTLGVVAALAMTSKANAMMCKDIFAKSPHRMPREQVQSLMAKIEAANDLILHKEALDRAAGREFSVDAKDLNVVLSTAYRLFQSQYTVTKVVVHQGSPALQIVPSNDSPWNRMAAAMQRNYKSMLLFAPAELARSRASALFEVNTKEDRFVLISRESLMKGRGEMATAEELSHLASYERAKTDPHPFTGAVTSFNPQYRPTIAKGVTSYSDYMTFDELARNAKNFVRIARDLESGRKSARNAIVNVAKNARAAIAVTNAALNSAQAVTRAITLSAEGSGPAMNADGTPNAKKAFVYASGDRQVYLESVSSGVVRVKLEDLDLDIEIFVRDGDGSLARLIPGLVVKDAHALRQFKAKLPGVINDWARSQHIAIDGLKKSIASANAAARSSDAELARGLRHAQTAIAPLLVRRK